MLTTYFDKYNSDPVGHGMCPGPPKVPIDDNHGDQDTHGVHDEGEQQILK